MAERPEGYGDEYEILPHKELVELRDELRALRQRPNEKNLQISMVELAAKMDKLMDIFEEAMQQVRLEGGLTVEDRLKPYMQKLDKVLEQNAQIAEGIVAVADLIKELQESGRPPAQMPSFEGFQPPKPPMGAVPPPMKDFGFERMPPFPNQNLGELPPKRF